jgi:murein L,D-transpeptidase YcbB/YkuD
MRSGRFEWLLAGTAVVVALTLIAPGGSALAEPTPAATSDTKPASDPKPAEASDAATAKIDPQANKAGEASPAAATAGTTDAAAPAVEATSSVPTATAAAAPVDPTTEKLRDLLTAGKFDRILGGRKERAAVEAFYAARGFAPLWIADGAINARGKAAAGFLAGVAADALDPGDYPVPEIKPGAAPEALAEAEIRFTDSVLNFTRHASGGRVHFSRVAFDIQYNIERPEPADVLAKLAAASDVGATLDGYNPQQPGYKALKAKLAEARKAPPVEAKKEEKPVEKVRIAEGPLLRPNMSDARVVALRKRLDIEGDKDSRLYDVAVVEAVRAFQMQASIEVDGMLGPNTVRALNGERQAARKPAVNPVDAITANMERWRWLPRELGKTYVMVNVPNYSLRVVRDNKLVWQTKIVVGKPNLATPMTSAEMKFITVNPTWNVPPSIIQNEYLPALQQDPQALERIGLKIAQEPDGTVRIWQPPGDRNALGRIRFNFPNKFLVYQHDTPDKHLFKHEKRAYSHGCMRVEDPLKYGEVLLSLVLPNEKYTQERLRGMFGGSEININFPTTIPVHLTYQTAFVDDEGKLAIRDDVYGRDAKLLALLKGSERKVADTAIDRPRNNSAAPVRVAPGTYGSGGGFFSGPSLFERLFGGASAEPPRPAARVGRNEQRHSVR